MWPAECEEVLFHRTILWLYIDYTWYDLPDDSVKAGAWLGQRWSSVCVGVYTRRGGLKADLPTQDMLDMRAARVECRCGWSGV